jgi:hypothetical protein
VVPAVQAGGVFFRGMSVSLLRAVTLKAWLGATLDGDITMLTGIALPCIPWNGV